jgi:uncharacterized protein YutE (UPF0331/DUF86 family)
MLPNSVKEEIELEIKNIEKLLKSYGPLLKKVETQKPDYIELGALAMLLHSFYNGLENIFTRIARKIDQKVPTGELWHTHLLEQMTKQTKKRKDVMLSNETYKDLKKYLGFRHFSRHAYAFDLEWQLMKELVERIDDVSKRALDEIRFFMSKTHKAKK